MDNGLSIAAPAGFVPQHAIVFGDPAGRARTVSAADPLPIAVAIKAATSTPLAGVSSAAAATIGPFAPVLGRSIWLTLDGGWSGTVSVMRSIDGGATMQPLTVAGQPWASFTANANEPIGEESVSGAGWYIAVALTAGTLSYRLAQ